MGSKNFRLDEKKIKKALKEGKLIDYDEIFARYPREKQQRILEGARYLLAAIELRKLRKKLKLSQSQLARKMDVKREFISRIESGQQNITLETLYRIAEATGKKFEFQFK